jgi:hypothetical protein
MGMENLNRRSSEMGQQPKNDEFSSADEAGKKVAKALQELDGSRMVNVKKRKKIMREADLQERHANEAYGDTRPYWNKDD